jgi:hypothetical protein
MTEYRTFRSADCDHPMDLACPNCLRLPVLDLETYSSAQLKGPNMQPRDESDGDYIDRMQRTKLGTVGKPVPPLPPSARAQLASANKLVDETDAEFNARLDKAFGVQPLPGAPGAIVSGDAWTPLPCDKPIPRAPIAPGVLIDDDETRVYVSRKVARWAGALALVAGGASIMYAEAQHHAMPGVGFAVGLAMIVGAALLATHEVQS